MPQPANASSRELHLDEVLAAYYDRVEAGQLIDRQAFIDQYPDLAEELTAFFSAKDDFERQADPLLPATGPPHEGDGQSAPAAGERLRCLGDYEVLEEIARGGMGIVYKARQISLNRLVALKMIRTGHLASARDVERLRAEAALVANLDHPHIVPVYEVGEHEGQPYFTMKLIEGRSLAELLRQGPLDPQQAARLLSRVARAVDHAHRAAVLHRDLKPGNVLLDAEGQPHVADFGLARRMDGRTSLTSSGIIGTVGYLAPEQAAGSSGRLTTAADVWALGAILFECLTGRPPFVGESLLAVLRKVQEEEPPAPQALRPRLDSDLATVCAKCLRKEPEQRYGTALELAEDLERWLAGEPVRARPLGTVSRLWRWCRRHPLPALLAAVLLVVGLGVAVGSSLAARSYRLLAEAEQIAAADAITARDQEETARKQVEKERDAKQAALVEALGLRLAAQTTVALGTDQSLALLLGIEAVKRAPGAISHNALRAALDVCREERLLPLSEEHRELLSSRLPQWFAESYFGPRRVSFLNGGTCLSEIQNGAPVVRDVRSGKVLSWIVPNLAPPREYVISPDGKRVAMLSRNDTFHFARNDRRESLVVRFTDRVVRLWDLRRGQYAGTLRGHTQRVNTVAFSPDGKRLLTASDDGTARIWDADRLRLLEVLKHDSAVRIAAFDPRGARALTLASRQVISGGGYPRALGGRDVRGGAMQFLDGDGTELPCEVDPDNLDGLKYHPYGHGDGGIHPGGHTFKGDPGFARLWDVGSGKEVRRWSIDKISADGLEPTGVNFSPDGRFFAVTVKEGMVLQGSTVDTSWSGVLRDRKGGIGHSQFAPDSRRLLTVCGKHARLWDLAGRELDVLKGHEGPILQACFSPDGVLAATVSEDRTCRIWDLTSGDAIAVLRADRFAVDSVAFHPDGRHLATSSGGMTRIWRLEPGPGHVRVLRGHADRARSLAYSPDGRELVTASDDKTARVWDTAMGELRGILQGHAPDAWFRLQPTPRDLREHIVGPMRLARFSPSGQSILTLSADARPRYQARPGERFHDLPWTPVRIWDRKTLRESLAVPGIERKIVTAELSPDGQRLLVAEGWPEHAWHFDLAGNGLDTPSSDERRKISPIEVRILDAGTGRVVTRLRGFTHEVQVACFSPDGRRVLTLAEERPGDRYSVGALRLWDAGTGKEVASHQTESGESWRPRALLSPDGKSVLFGTTIFDAQTLKALARLEVKVGGIDAVFSPDGARLAGTCNDGMVVWDTATGKRLLLFLAHKDGGVESHVFSSDGKLLVTVGCTDRTVRVWDAGTGKELQTLAGHDAFVTLAAIRPDGKEVATVSADHTVRLWRLDLLDLAESRKARDLTLEERTLYLEKP